WRLLRPLVIPRSDSMKTKLPYLKTPFHHQPLRPQQETRTGICQDQYQRILELVKNTRTGKTHQLTSQLHHNRDGPRNKCESVPKAATPKYFMTVVTERWLPALPFEGEIGQSILTIANRPNGYPILLLRRPTPKRPIAMRLWVL